MVLISGVVGGVGDTVDVGGVRDTVEVCGDYE